MLHERRTGRAAAVPEGTAATSLHKLSVDRHFPLATGSPPCRKFLTMDSRRDCEIGRIQHLKSEIADWDWQFLPAVGSVQFKISDFGFEVAAFRPLLNF